VNESPPRPPRSPRRRWILPLGLLALFVGAILLAEQDIPVVSALATAAVASGAVLLLFWGFWRLLRAFLWKVGRRLAFSYFLIGVLPIPMALLLLAVAAYLLSGYMLGYLYRDAAQSLQSELGILAAARAREVARTGQPPGESEPPAAFGYYRDGRKVAGDPRLPAAWPAWLERSTLALDGRKPAPFVELPDGEPAAAAAVSSRGWGVVALATLPLEAELSARSDVWVEMARPGDADSQPVDIGLGSRSLKLQVSRQRAAVEAQKFFRTRSQGERLWDDPILWWGDTSARLVRLAGNGRAESLHITLHSTPRVLAERIFSTSAEVDTTAWGVLIVLAFLLFDVYVVATVMAVFLIFGLSRAVNRMSQATAAVQAGDFAVRIPVKRKDQVGALQRSFNQMAANLETLVASAAQKEVLDKELALARDLQKSLLPGDLPAHLSRGVELASLFEPSAALGGDYFDLLRLDERRQAVFIADVSGHGLSSGLRMAMIKAALLILVQEEGDPEAILRRLDSVVRANRESRFFVTATLGILDLEDGTLDLTNAGHPPTYLLRGGEVEEILLPGSPLGGLGTRYGRRTVTLEWGDVVVWLSDGLIEATDPAGNPFGYDRITAALAGPHATAAEVRDRLLKKVDRHAAGQPPADDRTVVVLRWTGGAGQG
jgi:serine phosphatase RsbU (regulator of sigma subunit)